MSCMQYLMYVSTEYFSYMSNNFKIRNQKGHYSSTWTRFNKVITIQLRESSLISHRNSNKLRHVLSRRRLRPEFFRFHYRLQDIVNYSKHNECEKKAFYVNETLCIVIYIYIFFFLSVSNNKKKIYCNWMRLLLFRVDKSNHWILSVVSHKTTCLT